MQGCGLWGGRLSRETSAAGNESSSGVSQQQFQRSCSSCIYIYTHVYLCVGVSMYLRWRIWEVLNACLCLLTRTCCHCVGFILFAFWLLGFISYLFYYCSRCFCFCFCCFIYLTLLMLLLLLILYNLRLSGSLFDCPSLSASTVSLYLYLYLLAPCLTSVAILARLCLFKSLAWQALKISQLQAWTEFPWNFPPTPNLTFRTYVKLNFHSESFNSDISISLSWAWSCTYLI